MATKYKNTNDTAHPSFSVKFIMDIVKMRNDPSFVFGESNTPIFNLKSLEYHVNMRTTVRKKNPNAGSEKSKR